MFQKVINPCIRFSWFEDEWDKEYITLAKSIILKVVSENAYSLDIS